MQNRPGSDLDGLVRVWPNASGPEANRCARIIWTSFWKEATGPLPVSDFQTRFRSSTDVPDNIVENQPGSDLVLADRMCQVWAKRIRSGSKPVCKTESSGPLLANAFQSMRPKNNYRNIHTKNANSNIKKILTAHNYRVISLNFCVLGFPTWG